MGGREAEEVSRAICSGWITTGPRTKEFEKRIAAYCHTEKAVCLNSATACLESILRILGIGPGDEVIACAYTYTASVSVVCHVGAKLVLLDTAPGSFEMDYSRLADAITERTKAVIPVDLGGVVCDYDKVFAAVESRRSLFRPSNDLQAAIGRVAVVADAAHAFGARWHGRMCGEIADFTSFSFHAVKNLTTAEGGALTWRPLAGVDDEWLYKQFQLMSLHGQNKDALASEDEAGGLGVRHRVSCLQVQHDGHHGGDRAGPAGALSGHAGEKAGDHRALRRGVEGLRCASVGPLRGGPRVERAFVSDAAVGA